jgi:hypothetical protein
MPTRERVQQFVRTVEQGKFIEAMEEFYADDLVMQENLQPPRVGKAANMEHERKFVSWIADVKSRAAAVLVDGNHVVINWVADYVGVDGVRLHYDQLTHQVWRGDEIVAERFVYDPGSLAAAA